MNIYFLKDDSLFKIFKTLEKVSQGKTIQVHIAHDNQFFDNIWRGKQIAELCEKKDLDVTFVVTSQRQVRYCEACDLPYRMEYAPKILDLLRMMYLFFFNIKKFHILLMTKKTRWSLMIMALEAIGLVSLAFFFYLFVVPSTTITLYPSLQTERFVYNVRYYPFSDTQFPLTTNQLSVPYYTWRVTLTYSTQFALDDFLTIQTPAQGTVRFLNTTAQAIPLRANTQLVTDEGLVYRTREFVTLPPAVGWNAWMAVAAVVADARDVNNAIIGARGNIGINHRLYIRRLTQSYYTKEIYALAVTDFAWWTTVTNPDLRDSDIQTLKKTLEETIERSTDSGIKSRIPDTVMLLPRSKTWFRDEFFYEIIDNAILSWTIVRTLPYRYVWKRDLIRWFNQHLSVRRSQLDTIVALLESSLVFLEIRETGHDRFTIATQVSLVRWYNFQTDANMLKADMTQRIRGLSAREAKRIIENYDEVARADIAISPFWYDTVSRIQSRIRFEIITR